MIVSLTSHPARFGTLPRTLRCLLNQSVSPDRIILWIAHADIDKIPQEVSAFESRGVEIRACEDFRSLKKIAPALEHFPDATIVTADDDLYYPRDWLERLVEKADGSIVAHWYRRPIWLGTRYAEIMDWPSNEQCEQPSFLTGAGVLFPPGALHPDAKSYADFNRLTPTCDDIFLTWQAARAGSHVIHSGWTGTLIEWERTTSSSLRVANFGADYDRKDMHAALVQNLVDAYGPLHQLKDK